MDYNIGMFGSLTVDMIYLLHSKGSAIELCDSTDHCWLLFVSFRWYIVSTCSSNTFKFTVASRYSSSIARQKSTLFTSRHLPLYGNISLSQPKHIPFHGNTQPVLEVFISLYTMWSKYCLFFGSVHLKILHWI